MEILRIENLTKTYGTGENLVRALDNVSFSVEKGEFISIIGPSGSGKSTLLHIIGGVDRPTSGKVYMNGQDVYAQNEEQLAIYRVTRISFDVSFGHTGDRFQMTNLVIWNLSPVLTGIFCLTPGGPAVYPCLIRVKRSEERHDLHRHTEPVTRLFCDDGIRIRGENQPYA